MTDLSCSFPGCERHPSKGDDILRISAKGRGQPFIGRCREHYGAEIPSDLAQSLAYAKRPDVQQALLSPAPTEGPARRDDLSPEQVEKLKTLGWCGCNTACALLPVEQARTGRKCRYVAGEVRPISKLNKAASDLVDAAAPTEGPGDGD